MENLISIIVPVYNSEKYVKDTVQSILHQTYKNIEVILVDDGSKDNSPSIIDELALSDSRITVLHKENAGVTLARIDGIKIAKGDYIGFVDSDDYIEKDMYEFLLNNAIKYDADISHCGYQMIFSDGRIHYFHNTGEVIEQDNLIGLEDLLEGSKVEPGLWNKLYKKELLDRLLNEKVMDYSIKINEDLLMNYYLFKYAAKSLFVDLPKYHYIVRENSATRVKLNKNKIYDPIKVKEIIMNDSYNNISDLTRKVYLRTCINCLNSIMISGGFKNEAKDIKKKIVNEKQYSYLLDKNGKLLFTMIVNGPLWLYKIIYRIYYHTIQKRVYE